MRLLSYFSSRLTCIRTIGETNTGIGEQPVYDSGTTTAGSITLDKVVVEPQIKSQENKVIDQQLQEILDNPAWHRLTGREREIFVMSTLGRRGYCNLSGSDHYNPRTQSHIFMKDGNFVVKINFLTGTYTSMNGAIPSDAEKIIKKAGLAPKQQ
ncbi:hypothetical protein HYX05_03690 [Candidatus Woesearchaeota archaeon]|nr:hypothetical protein [Candidatus Woesearchaeota archaeon]